MRSHEKWSTGTPSQNGAASQPLLDGSKAAGAKFALGRVKLPACARCISPSTSTRPWCIPCRGQGGYLMFLT